MMILKGKHIFISEDNPQNRVIFQMVFARSGAHVSFERMGRDTVFQLKMSPRVDLIILDLMLAQGVSGFEIYDEIRALPKYDTIPIIAVSAMDPAIALPKLRSKGFNGFIAKPIDNQLFPQQIAQIIEGQAVWYAGERSIS